MLQGAWCLLVLFRVKSYLRAASCNVCCYAACWRAPSCAHACEQVLCLLAKAHVDLGDGSTAALNCIARLRHDVPDVGGNRGVLPLLALQAYVQLDRYAPLSE